MRLSTTLSPSPLALAAALLCGSARSPAQNADSIWQQFTASLLQKEITADRIRPYRPELTEGLLRSLELLRQGVPAGQWHQSPSSRQVGNLLHYIVPFELGSDTSTFCFTLVTAGDRWYFCHLENIFIRLDTVSSLPASSFPDLPAKTKAWMREEKYWSQIVYLFTTMAKEKGTNYALNMLKDGLGYALEAKSWVPFVPPRKAFVLYLCWEQSVLKGNDVVLEQLSDTSARMSLKPIYFLLYKRAGHLSRQISFEDYRRIFETIWHDRAANAGWRLRLEYPSDEECTIILRGS